MMKKARLDNWRSALWAQLSDDRQFIWGVNDCFMFCDRCIEAMTGAPVFTPYRGKYHSEREALDIVRKEGGFEAFGDKLLIPAGYKRTENPGEGDIVLCKWPNVAPRKGEFIMAGVHTGGTRVAVLLENAGVLFSFNRPIVAAWHIG